PRVIRELPRNRSEFCHELFDFPPDKSGTEQLDGLANKLIAATQSKCDPGSEHSISGCKEGCGEGILGAGMDGVAPGATCKRETHVASFERNDALRCHLEAEYLQDEVKEPFSRHAINRSEVQSLDRRVRRCNRRTAG